jgi:hypothetical protein
MKLEAKHIAPYLPYKLNFWHTKLKDKRELTQVKVRKDGDVLVDIESETLVYISSINDSWIKPILRPLSDLTKEMLDEWYNIIAENGISVVSYANDLGKNHTLTVSYKMMGDAFTDIVYSRNSVKYTDYWICEKLLEQHFDVFGLIGQGLAIDINTLNK